MARPYKNTEKRVGRPNHKGSVTREEAASQSKAGEHGRRNTAKREDDSHSYGRAHRSPHGGHDRAPSPFDYDGMDKGSAELASAGHEGTEELSILPGIKPVLELLDSDPARIDTVLIRRGRRSADTDTLMDKCRLNHVRFNLVDGPALEKLYTGAHQGVVARLYAAGYIEVDKMLAKAMDAPLPIIIALDQVQDPGNAGTLARSLYALGGAGLIVPRHNAAYLGASAQRAAAGALEKLPVARVTNLARALDEAIEAGFTIYGAMLGDESVNAFATKLHTPCVLVLGNEDKGIRPNVAKRCDRLLHIPMLRDFDSLNVAQAGALLLGEFARDILVKK